MDVCLVIKARLEELGLDQKGLAAAAEVTESYISQLLTRKKLPPAPGRTDIYEKMGKFLKLSSAKLAKLAQAQRNQELKRALEVPPAPLFAEVRELVLGKCAPDKRQQIREIFEKQPFGELEGLVTQKLLELIKLVARRELANEKWLLEVARLSGRNYKQLRVKILDFLDTDVFGLSSDDCDSFLDPLIESWDIDLSSFSMEVVLNKMLAPGQPSKFEFTQRQADDPREHEPGLVEFLADASLSGNASQEEIEFLTRLRFKEKRPSPLYYYRELQNLRDPLHFR
jgi:transcriptional regulator with XRE-family HTH domain